MNFCLLDVKFKLAQVQLLGDLLWIHYSFGPKKLKSIRLCFAATYCIINIMKVDHRVTALFTAFLFGTYGGTRSMHIRSGHEVQWHSQRVLTHELPAHPHRC